MCRQNSGKPFIWGVTGGIGSGKSYVCRLLAERGWPVFSCDDEAKRLIRHDVQLRRQLTEVVGPMLYASDGTLNKAVMAAFLCAGPQQAAPHQRTTAHGPIPRRPLLSMLPPGLPQRAWQACPLPSCLCGLWRG